MLASWSLYNYNIRNNVKFDVLNILRKLRLYKLKIKGFMVFDTSIWIMYTYFNIYLELIGIYVFLMEGVVLQCMNMII